jgi:hypothetical protein
VSQGEGKSFKASIEDLALAELETLTKDRETVAAELAEIDDTIKSVRKILGVVTPKVTRAARKNGGSTTKISARVREDFIAFATGNPDEITAKTIASALGVGDSYGNMVAKQMREEGVLRLAATSGSMKIYRSEI